MATPKSTRLTCRKILVLAGVTEGVGVDETYEQVEDGWADHLGRSWWYQQM